MGAEFFVKTSLSWVNLRNDRPPRMRNEIKDVTLALLMWPMPRPVAQLGLGQSCLGWGQN